MARVINCAGMGVAQISMVAWLVDEASSAHVVPLVLAYRDVANQSVYGGEAHGRVGEVCVLCCCDLGTPDDARGFGLDPDCGLPVGVSVGDGSDVVS